MAFAIPNGGARNAITGAMLKREGVKKGVFDVFIGWARNGKHGLFLEFKKQKGGTVTPEQEQFAEIMTKGWIRVPRCKRF